MGGCKLRHGKGHGINHIGGRAPRTKASLPTATASSRTPATFELNPIAKAQWVAGRQGFELSRWGATSFVHNVSAPASPFSNPAFHYGKGCIALVSGGHSSNQPLFHCLVCHVYNPPIFYYLFGSCLPSANILLFNMSHLQ